MNSRDLIGKIREAIEKLAGSIIQPGDIKFEGPHIVVYTRNPRFFLESDKYIAEIAKEIRKRVIIRLERSLLMDIEKAEEEIRRIIPEEANITHIYFDPVFGEVVIEALKPGLVIGLKGENLQRIKRKTLWIPKVARTPTMESKIIESIRKLVYLNSAKRLNFFLKLGERIYRDKYLNSSWIRITSLGGSREVGRSCFLLQTPESSILLDCGINVGSWREPFPFLDAPELDIDELDAVVVSHAHLDHSGAVPILFKYGYRGPVYCTEPTRDLMVLLQLDYIEVLRRDGRHIPYTFKDIQEEISHTISLDYESVTNVSPDVKITLYNAGHILGSAMVHVHIGEGIHNIVYTGDFKFADTTLLKGCNYNFPRLETLIMESTYGSMKDTLPPRSKAENLLMEIINNTIRREGTVLIPVLAVGRAQEILLTLEKNFRQGKLPEVPVYIDGMVLEATAIHTAYPSYLSENLQEKILHKSINPFESPLFSDIPSKEARIDILEGEPCIILATSGMLTGGPVIEYFKNMASNPMNSIIFVSYQVNGTLGRDVQRQGKGGKVLLFTGNKRKSVEINMDVCTVEGFSGHSDWMQLISFAGKVQPKPSKVIIVHGERNKGQILANAIKRIRKVDISVPYNLESIRLV